MKVHSRSDQEILEYIEEMAFDDAYFDNNFDADYTISYAEALCIDNIWFEQNEERYRLHYALWFEKGKEKRFLVDLVK